MNPLLQIITREIYKTGVISFARFMELALYCPVCGFYEKEKDNLGSEGDFFTSVSVGNLFGELLAFQFSTWLEQLDPRTTPLTVCEAGAHDGRLAKDILTWLRRKRTALFDRLQYHIVEPSARRQQWQQENLAGFGDSIRWVSRLQPGADSVPFDGIRGIMFSNELLDAMPVRRIGWDAKRHAWFEWGVTLDRDQFVWTRIQNPESALPVPALPEPLLELLPDDFTTEVNVSAEQWWRAAAGALHEGRLLTIDYGLSADEFFRPERKEGTLRAYYRHRLAADVLARVGEQDLTAHVNFTAIQAAGESAGLETEALVSQETFLNRIAGLTRQRPELFDEWSPARARQFQTLTHPEHLGRPFRVLIQSRGGRADGPGQKNNS